MTCSTLFDKNNTCPSKRIPYLQGYFHGHGLEFPRLWDETYSTNHITSLLENKDQFVNSLLGSSSLHTTTCNTVAAVINCLPAEKEHGNIEYKVSLSFKNYVLI